MTTVAILFSDSSLGGTSRSALTMARIWRRIGWSVVFVTDGDVDARRLDAFTSQGPVESLASVDWSTVSMIHWHQGGNERLNRAVFESLSQSRMASLLPILTNNIFAYPDRYLRSWPSAYRVSVLGIWAAWQYRLASGRACRFPAVVGNPQDEGFFRPPSPSERYGARVRLGIDQAECVVLRIGSPIADKWSRSYIRLAKEVDSVGGLLLLVGVPEELEVGLSRFKRVLVMPQTGNDGALRDLYWAADVFALDAARGESFGNVATEALLCGCPVVYRARVFRDNTPWEFRNLGGFFYAPSERAWLSRLREVLLTDRLVRPRADSVQVARAYGMEATGERLSQAVGELGPYSSAERLDRRSPSFMDKASISLLHNPLIAYFKRVRRVFGLYGLIWRG